MSHYRDPDDQDLLLEAVGRIETLLEALLEVQREHLLLAKLGPLQKAQDDLKEAEYRARAAAREARLERERKIKELSASRQSIEELAAIVPSDVDLSPVRAALAQACAEMGIDPSELAPVRTTR